MPRKRFKQSRPKTVEKPDQPKERKYPKKEKTCSQVHGGLCEKHNRGCAIIVDFPKGDSRHGWKARLESLGAEPHGPDSEHRCIECEKERQIDSPWKELHVEGLDAAQQARLRMESQALTRRMLEKP
jgi:hypothetical protein